MPPKVAAAYRKAAALEPDHAPTYNGLGNALREERKFPEAIAAYEALGLRLVMGERDGVRFRDAYDGTWYVNCHCNGGVFNLGHRNPSVLAALRTALETDEIDVGNHHLVSGWKARLGARPGAVTSFRSGPTSRPPPIV